MVEIANLRWSFLLKLRWAALGLWLVIALGSHVLKQISYVSFLIFLAAWVVTFFLNLALTFFARPMSQLLSAELLSFQIMFDTVVVSIFLFLLGGISSPWIHFYFLNAAIAALVTPWHKGYFVWAMQHVVLALLQVQWLWRTDALSMAFIETGSVLHLTLFATWMILRAVSRLIVTQNTEIHRYEMFLQRQKQSRTLGALAAGLSHRLASPLNVALNTLIRLKNKFNQNSDEDSHEIKIEVNEALSSIEESTRILSLFNQSQLDIERGKFLVSCRWPQSVVEIIDAWKKDHDCFVNVNWQKRLAEGQRTVMLPKLALEQALYVLLDNAQEASKKASLNQIDVLLIDEEETIGLCVRDYGYGFPKHVLENIGEPFLTTKLAGHGLGLFSVRLLMDSLGGSLRVENLNVGGAKVCISWPTRDIL